MRRFLPILLLAAAPIPIDDAPPPGRVAGAPQQCITLGRNTESQIGDGRILYKPSGITWYGNRPVDCGILRNSVNVAVSTITPSTGLCRGDVIRVFDPNTSVPYGSCVLGPFVPYRRAPK